MDIDIVGMVKKLANKKTHEQKVKSMKNKIELAKLENELREIEAKRPKPKREPLNE